MIVKSPFDGTTPQIHPTAFIAKDAVIIGDVEIGEYVNMWFGAKIRGDWGKIVVGENTSIQENCVIHSTVKGFKNCRSQNSFLSVTLSRASSQTVFQFFSIIFFCFAKMVCASSLESR